MKRKFPFILLILSITIILLASCGPPPTPEPTPIPTVHPGKSLISSKCIGCHDINRVTSASFDRVGWELVVDRMVMSGTQLTEEQVDIVVDYLAVAYPEE